MASNVESLKGLAQRTPYGKHSLNREALKRSLQGSIRYEHRVSGGGNSERIKRRKDNILYDIRNMRAEHLEQAEKYSRYCDWRNDDLVQYLASARKRQDNGKGFQYNF